jgi:hypothetical protein
LGLRQYKQRNPTNWSRTMEIMLSGKFGNSFGWKHQISASRKPVVVVGVDGPYCHVFFYKR